MDLLDGDRRFFGEDVDEFCTGSIFFLNIGFTQNFCSTG